MDYAVLITLGIGTFGRRTMLGIPADHSPAGVHWQKFFSILVKVGLHGVEFIVKATRSGIPAAHHTAYLVRPRHRIQIYPPQNAQAYLPRMELRSQGAHDIRSIFIAPICAPPKARRKNKLTFWSQNRVQTCRMNAGQHHARLDIEQTSFRTSPPHLNQQHH